MQSDGKIDRMGAPRHQPQRITIDRRGINLTLQTGQTATATIENPPIGNFVFHGTLPGDDALQGTLSRLRLRRA